MTRPTHFKPSERSQWLADLSTALEQAEVIIECLDDETARSVEAHHLSVRISALRSEVEQLRRGIFANVTPIGRNRPKPTR
jgi:hypothetical protein